MRRNFLFVSPHPDDIELGAGGTVFKLKQQGYRVFVVDLTWGEPTPFGSQEKRRKETEEATKILGIEERVNLGLENRYLFDTKQARLKLAEKIRLFKPDILFSPYFEDAHPDHVASAEITKAARFYAKFTKINLKGKPFYPPYLFYYFCSHLKSLPKISFLVDVSEGYSQKLKALRAYKSQFIDNPQNRFVLNYIKERDRLLGRLINSSYAEAFFSEEPFKINDLALLL